MQKGSSQFGPDVVVGSKEYWTLWREKNREKYRLQQKAAYVKRKREAIAVQLAAGVEAKEARPVSYEEGVEMLEAEMRMLDKIRAKKKEEGIIEPANQNPIVVEYAEKYGLPYERAEQMIIDLPANASPEMWETTFQEDMASRLEGLIGKPLSELEEEEPTTLEKLGPITLRNMAKE